MQSVENAKGRKYGVYRTEWVTPLFPVLIRERPIAASVTSYSNEYMSASNSVFRHEKGCQKAIFPKSCSLSRCQIKSF